MSYRNFDTQRIFYGADIGKSHKWKSPKNRFFQNGLKFDLNALGYRFSVQNTSKTLQGSISGHISSFQSTSATISKIEFLSKITIFMIFWDFWRIKLRLAMWPEVVKIMIGGRKWSLWFPKTLLHTMDDILWSSQCNMKIIIFLKSFSFVRLPNSGLVEYSLGVEISIRHWK